MEFQKLFTESKGQPIEYKGKIIKMMDKLELINSSLSLCLEFISTSSQLKQGVIIQAKGQFEINGQIAPNKIILWEETAPKLVTMKIITKDNKLIIYNAWKKEDGPVFYWYNGGALYTEIEKDKITYYCNDGIPDDDFNDLIFRIWSPENKIFFQ
jgi:hypothetical protein